MVRLKSRYLLFEVLYPDQLTYSSPSSAGDVPHVLACMQLRQPPLNLDARRLLHAVKASISTNFGTQGDGQVKSTLAIKYFSPRTSTGILRVARDHFRIVWAALAYLTEIEGKRVVVRVIRVSGTIKKCEQAAIARDKQVIEFITKSASDNSIGLGLVDPMSDGESEG